MNFFILFMVMITILKYSKDAVPLLFPYLVHKILSISVTYYFETMLMLFARKNSIPSVTLGKVQERKTSWNLVKQLKFQKQM